MSARTQKLQDIVDAVVTQLKANAAIVALLGAGTDSVFQYQDENKLDQAIRNNPQAVAPALIVFSSDETWTNDGATHDRNPSFIVYTLVYDPEGFGARLAAANAIRELIYETLIQSTLGLAGPIPSPVQPGTAAYSHDMADEDESPMEISVWRNDFNTTVEWFQS